ncbi:MAG: sulfotransferase [Sandaracinaceae bacterium]
MHGVGVALGPLRVALRTRSERYAELPRVRRLLRAPIIIGGCGRSGTTLLSSVLSCHPHVHPIDRETNAFSPAGYTARPDLSLPVRWDWLYLSVLRRGVQPDERHVCEKTPRNVRAFGRLLSRIPEARLIHIVRDGRDVVTSRHPLHPERGWYVSPRRWVEDVTAGLAHRDHPRVLTVRYEDLVLEYERVVRVLCAFLDLPASDRFEEFPRHARMREHLAYRDRAVQPLSARSIGRWRRHPERARALIDLPEGAALLARLGYGEEA